jgi:1-acyl-sn-glycerol-3-phosphate acyltransferase
VPERGNGRPDAAVSAHPLASLLAWLARGISGVQVRWLDCEPSVRQRIYFANHTSHLDAAVIWAALPVEARGLARPVAAKDYWEQSALRRYLSSRVFRAVLIERGRSATSPSRAEARGVIDRLVEAMGDRCSLIVFPEGTRGLGDDVTQFKSGLYHLALRKPNVDLVPSYMENLNRILPKGEVLPVPLLSSVTFGPPLQVGRGEEKRAFLDRAREAVRRLRRS